MPDSQTCQHNTIRYLKMKSFLKWNVDPHVMFMLDELYSIFVKIY